jgi:folate-binding protein YgfZ
MAVITVSGPDAQKFLQGQLTCDMNKLSATHLLRGAHCNLKGRVEALYTISLQEGCIQLDTPDDVAAHGLAQLQPYARFSKVKLDLQMSGRPLDLAQHCADIKAGIARLHPETVGCFLPQELNLIEQGVIDFKKGCYLGQEIVARLHYLGKLKKHLVYQRLTGLEQDLEIVDACEEHALVLMPISV